MPDESQDLAREKEINFSQAIALVKQPIEGCPPENPQRQTT